MSRELRAILITGLFVLASAPAARAGLFNEARHALIVLDAAGRPGELSMWAVAGKSSDLPAGWTCAIPGLGASKDPDSP